MKLYFCGSIRAGRQDAEIYRTIIKHLKEYGHVFTEDTVGAKGNEIAADAGLTDKEIHDRDINWLLECDAVIAEVTHPSLGVGYEIGRSIAMEKKILCLYRSEPKDIKYLSAMITGAKDNTQVFVETYQLDKVADILKNFFSQIN